jgi:hypothetical protein
MEVEGRKKWIRRKGKIREKEEKKIRKWKQK